MKHALSSLAGAAALAISLISGPAMAADDGIVVYNAQHENLTKAWADGFYDAVRRYWPGLKDGALQAGYAGIRPKIVPKGAPAQDFVTQGPPTHGIGGLVNLFGIESPGLTAAIAIGAHVREMVEAG